MIKTIEDQVCLAPVLVVRVPELRADTMEQIRLKTIDAIRSGVWVVPHDLVWSVEQLPVLSGQPNVQAVNYVRLEEGKQSAPPADPSDLKRSTLQRLQAYRAKGGLGCFEALAKATRRKSITANILRSVITDGVELDLADWRAIAHGLDKLEKGEENGETDLVKT